MSFFTDILSGGGNLYRDVTPSWFRNLAPRELQPGGFNPGRDYLGVDLDGSLAKEQAMKQQAMRDQQAAAAQQTFDASANMPPVGMAPPPAQIPQLTGLLGGGGDYTEQAQQMAGLLGGGADVPGTPPAQSTPPYTPGRFMPGWRPGDPLLVTRGGGGRRFGPVRPF